MIKLDEQGKALIEAVAQVRAQIAGKEVQVSAMRSFATDRNPERIRAEAELSGLREQLGKLEQNGPKTNGGILVTTGKVPEVGLGARENLLRTRGLTRRLLGVGQLVCARHAAGCDRNHDDDDPNRGGGLPVPGAPSTGARSNIHRAHDPSYLP